MNPATAWAALPNAAHIDRILAHVRAHPDRWDAAWGAAGDAAWDASEEAAWDASGDAAWRAAGDAARVAARDAARYAAVQIAARGAVLALIAWDDVAALLELPPEEVAALAAMRLPAAVLLLPAVIAMQNT